MNITYVLFSFHFLFFLFACSTNTLEHTHHSVQKTAFLTQEQAQKRAELISNVSYDLFFDLTKGDKEFYGKVLIEFDLKEREGIRIDFNKGKVISLKSNGVKTSYRYDDISIQLTKETLKKGYNLIEIDFSHDYSKDGSGLYYFKDTEDNKVYTYSDLEPYDANRIFPCFDQPNLKAHYTQKVKVPKTWKISTYALEEKILNDGENKIWHFPRSHKFSTYIWSLHAGEYTIVHDTKAKYPSRLFMRQSMKKYVKVKDWQTFTRQGFEFLDDYFGISYPYHKYDQLIVPDFNAGAMENVAAVTFAERFVSRGEKTQKSRRRLANVIFHEMAHMWFGNLVTMNWWDDLWLNESFATYIAYLGVSRNTEFKDVTWRDFNGTKEWAYWEDQLVTTHPIVTKVPDTNQAFANFDGITYGKGASSLKQIHYYLGEEGFKKGLRIYFRRHANKNTELKDFIKALSEGANMDLDDWQSKWLETTGVNTIKISSKVCKQNQLKELTLEQIPSANGIIRPHSFELAFLNKVQNTYKIIKTHKVSMQSEKKITINFENQVCPDFIYPNYNDHDYLLVDLDQKSLEIIESDIDLISDSFLKQMLWKSLWNMVYYGKYSYHKYFKIALRSLKDETDDIITKHLIETLSNERKSVLYYSLHDSKLSKNAYKNTQARIYDTLLTKLKNAPKRSELQKILFDAIINVAEQSNQLDLLIQILESKIKFKGIVLDQDKRWAIISKLSLYKHHKARQLLAIEKQNDHSSRAKKWILSIDAQAADINKKKKWLEIIEAEQDKYSFSELKSVMWSLFPVHQIKIKEEIFPDFIESLVRINAKKESHVAATVAKIIPTTCQPIQSEEISKMIAQYSVDFKASVLKQAKIRKQENDRCISTLHFRD